MKNSFKTFLKHTAKDFHNQSVNPPVVRASTIIFKSMKHIRNTQSKAKKNPTGGHYDYGRQGTSTTHILQKILTKQGIKFRLNCKVSSIENKDNLVKIKFIEKNKNNEDIIEADKVLVSVGRKPYTEGLNLSKIGINKDEKGRIEVNSKLQTSIKNIYSFFPD